MVSFRKKEGLYVIYLPKLWNYDCRVERVHYFINSDDVMSNMTEVNYLTNDINLTFEPA